LKGENRPHVAANSDGVIVRIETEDPDVVILLIGD
jgi:hypothetical protein